MVYGLETVAVTKKQVEEMEVAEMKMLRFAMGVTRKDKIRNEYIRSTVNTRRTKIYDYLEGPNASIDAHAFF